MEGKKPRDAVKAPSHRKEIMKACKWCLMKYPKKIQQGQGTAMRNREHIVRIFWFEGMSNAGGDNESWPKVIFFNFFIRKKNTKNLKHFYLP